MRNDDALSMAVADLKRQAPRLWAEFEKAFKEREQLRVNGCVQASADKVIVAQGRAQECMELSALFSDAIATADKIKAKLAASQK